MKKNFLTTLGIVTGMSLFCSLPIYAQTPTFSDYWYQDTQGTWKIKDNNGNLIKDAWLCDDAVASNGQNIWYLIDSNGNMVSAGLVQDQTGNIYSLETSHAGFYGMLRYQSGVYDGVYLDLTADHSGAFGNINNEDGRSGLQAIYGLTQVNIDNSNIVYTSSFRNAGYASSNQSTGNTGKSSSSLTEEEKRMAFSKDGSGILTGEEKMLYDLYDGDYSKYEALMEQCANMSLKGSSKGVTWN